MGRYGRPPAEGVDHGVEARLWHKDRHLVDCDERACDVPGIADELDCYELSGRNVFRCGRRSHVDLEGLGLDRGLSSKIDEAIPEGPKRERVKDRANFIVIPIPQRELVDRRDLTIVQPDVDITYEPHQVPVEEHLIAVRSQVLPEPRGLIIQMLIDPLEGSVPGNELRSRLLPHTGYARQIVRGVAL